jgi:undecaprenyl diphosphate synthase
MTAEEDLKIQAELQAASQKPGHIAIIMDGNGRWAREQGLGRILGHRAGIEAVRDVVTAARNLEFVKTLTLYAFSIENWQRPRVETTALMGLLQEFLKKEADTMRDNQIRLRAIGRLDQLPPRVRKTLDKIKEYTAEGTAMDLVLALSYGARDEIVSAVKKLATAVRDGTLAPEEIDRDLFARNLYSEDLPDPDLLIRTSGEMRVSNFLLWQIAYTEIWITPILWPDFRRQHLYEAIRDYSGRSRRFGRVDGL